MIESDTLDSVHFLPTYLVPNLDEMIASEKAALRPGPYNRAAFTEFLRLYHCTENLEFIMDIDRYISRYGQTENVPFLDDESILETLKLVKFWHAIYETYLSRDAPKEVNVPGKLLNHFIYTTLPEPKELRVLRKAVYELLLTNYNDFITCQREVHNDRRCHNIHTNRRFLDVAPETVVTLRSPSEEASLPELIFQTISPDLLAQWEKTLENYELLKLASLCELSGTQSRANSAGAVSTRPSSRGLSLGSVFDNIKEYSGWKKTVKKLRPRRASSEKPQENEVVAFAD